MRSCASRSGATAGGSTTSTTTPPRRRRSPRSAATSGIDLAPTAVRVSRWPGAFPQYRPHHRDWLAASRAGLPAGVFVTGASYDGIGIPACIDQAQRTAAAVASHLTRP